MADNDFVFAAQEKLPPAKIMAQALAQSQGMIFYEAMAIVVKNYGFLGFNLSKEKSKALIGACLACDIKAVSMPSESMPKLAPALEIKKADFSGQYLIYENQGLQLKAELEKLKVIAYAPISRETIKVIKEKQGPGAGEKAMRLGIMMATGLPLGLGKSKEVSREIHQSETLLYLDMIFDEELRLRINSDNFDFSCLKEQKGYSSHTNFKNLCLKLAETSPKAWKNSALFDLLDGAMAPSFKYETLSDLEKEEKRLILAQMKNF